MKIDKNKMIAMTGGILLVAALAFTFITRNSTNGDEDVKRDKEISFSLPQTDKINVATSPALYDFCNGSFGWQSDTFAKYVKENPDPTFIFVTKDGTNVFYFSTWAPFQGDPNDMKNYLPQFSTDPQRRKFVSNVDYSQFTNDIDSISKEKFTEGKYSFYVVPALYNGKVNGTTLNDFVSAKKPLSNQSKLILAGVGYPTDFIVRRCDTSLIKEKFMIDFNDPFWKTYQYSSHVKVMKDGSPNDYCVVTPISTRLVAGSSEIINTFRVNGEVYPGGLNYLEKVFKDSGYESIQSAYEKKQYADSKIVEEYDGRLPFKDGQIENQF